MTNTPGDGQEPDGGQPGYWEQQAGSQPQPPPYGAPQYGQPPYGAPQYGQPPYGQAGYPVAYAPDHPKATTALVLGILGVVLCQVIAPFAWRTGKRTLDEIDASQGQVGGRGAAQAGYVLGIVGTVLLGLAALYLVFMVGLLVLGLGVSTVTYGGILTGL